MLVLILLGNYYYLSYIEVIGEQIFLHGFTISSLPLLTISIHSCIDLSQSFIAVGTSTNQLLGTCETLWEPDLEPEDLFETISQTLLSSVDRDALAGWGAHVYVITKEKVTKRLLRGMSSSWLILS